MPRENSPPLPLRINEIAPRTSPSISFPRRGGKPLPEAELARANRELRRFAVSCSSSAFPRLYFLPDDDECLEPEREFPEKKIR
jgi:hypothetical protein